MKYHLIGICGTGMGALAGMLKRKGHDVRGSDSGVYPPMSEQLFALEIEVFDGYHPANLNWGPDVVIVGNTCSKNHIEVVAAQEKNIELHSLPDTLGKQFLAGSHSIVVTGTHGKTTTTSMITHILRHAETDPGWFIGGIPLGMSHGFGLGNGETFVVEGDEYDSAFFDKGSKFLHYSPNTAVMTSLEFDHADIFDSFEDIQATFRKFIELIPQTGLLVVSHAASAAMELAGSHAGCTVESYAIVEDDETSDATWVAKEITQLKNGRCSFSAHRNGQFFEQFETLMVGNHNIQNMLAAIAVCASRGLTPKQIKTGVSTFAGIRRRQEIRGIAQGVYVLDDYAHHPTAIRETIGALRNRFSRRRIVVAFEPRSATSRRNVFQDAFGEALAHADVAIVGKLHAPDKIPEEERLDPNKLATDIHQRGTKAQHFTETEDIVEYLVDQVVPGDVVAIMSSGAFDGLHEKLLYALGDAVMPARIRDIPPIKKILSDLDLLTIGVSTESADRFLVLRNETGFVGCVGLEVFGEDAILRSLAVKKSARGVGYGWLLADTIIAEAKHRGVKQLYLVTQTAKDYFAEKHGFRIIEAATASPAVRESDIFQAEMCADATAMRLDL